MREKTLKAHIILHIISYNENIIINKNFVYIYIYIFYFIKQIYNILNNK